MRRFVFLGENIPIIGDGRFSTFSVLMAISHRAGPCRGSNISDREPRKPRCRNVGSMLLRLVRLIEIDRLQFSYRG